MFNFLVSYAGWPEGKQTLGRDRIFEYTAEELEGHFAPRSGLDTVALMRLPVLFAPEAKSDPEQVARVGSITKIRAEGKKYELSYRFDEGVDPIPVQRLLELSSELEIGEYELSRTHWAIKDVDLFEVLFKAGKRKLAPRVFPLSGKPQNRRLVSVMMPFDAAFTSVYDTIKATVEGMKRVCQRADDIWEHEAILHDVVELIETSAIVVCDLSGRNPNVFYETGIAHTLGRDVILITQAEDDVPFDLRQLRYIKYLNNSEGRADLGSRLRSRIQTLSERL